MLILAMVLMLSFLIPRYILVLVRIWKAHRVELAQHAKQRATPQIAGAAAIPARPAVAPARPTFVEPATRSLAVPVEGLRGGQRAAAALEQQLHLVRGVIRAYVSPVTSIAYVEFRARQCSDARVVAAIGAAGYGAGTRIKRFIWTPTTRAASGAHQTA